MFVKYTENGKFSKLSAKTASYYADVQVINCCIVKNYIDFKTNLIAYLINSLCCFDPSDYGFDYFDFFSVVNLKKKFKYF